MDSNKFILEFDGVTDIESGENGKCILTFSSPKYIEQLSAVLEKFENLEAHIAIMEGKVKNVNKSLGIGAKINDFDEKAKGLQKNIESMLYSLGRSE